jgi:hypothetical protein
VKELIEDLGGTVINRMAHLRQQDQQLVSSRGFVWRSAWGDLPSVILISDKHHRTLKYLMALAAVPATLHDPHPFIIVLTTRTTHTTHARARTTHTHTRTEQGIPTIHYRWLLHSAEQGCPLPYRPYLLPAGVSLVDEKRIFQYVYLLLCLALLLWAHQCACVVGCALTATRVGPWRSLLVCLSKYLARANSWYNTTRHTTLAN